MEKLIKNNNKIAYIVSSGNYHRKVYQNGSSYVLKSYTETKVDYTVSAFRTYKETTSQKATVYVVDTAIRSCTYSTSTNSAGYSTTSKSGARNIASARFTITFYKSQVTQSWYQTGAPTFVSSVSSVNGITTYSYMTSAFPASVAVTSLSTLSVTTAYQNIVKVIAPLTPSISSESTTFTSSANNRTYYTTSNYISTFDAEFYGSAYPDVAAAYSSKTSAYSIHWTRFGYSEHRIPNSNGFFVLSTSGGGFTTSTSGLPKRIMIVLPGSPQQYYTRITSETRSSIGTTSMQTVVFSSITKTITTVWYTNESIVSQYTNYATSTIDISSRTY